MKNKWTFIELIFTLLVGVWVLYRLAKDAMNYADPGWHTTISGPEFMRLKVFLLPLVAIFFAFRIYRLMKGK